MSIPDSYSYVVFVHIYCVNRKRKMEEHLLAMTWKINYADITFTSNEGGAGVKL